MPDPVDPCLYTIGHSNQSFEAFRALLDRYKIDVLADVRSRPYSRFASQFNHEALAHNLAGTRCRYVFQGISLGGRPEAREFYDEAGYVLYAKVAESPRFVEGIRWLADELPRCRVAIMCSEEDPAICHRHLLISRVISERGVRVRHIRRDGSGQSYEEVAAASSHSTGQKSLFAGAAEGAWKSSKPVLAQPRRDDRPRRGAATGHTTN